MLTQNTSAQKVQELIRFMIHSLMLAGKEEPLGGSKVFKDTADRSLQKVLWKYPKIILSVTKGMLVSFTP